MVQVKVVKATSASGLEDQINAALGELIGFNITDIKVSGAYDGKNESFLAVIMYYL